MAIAGVNNLIDASLVSSIKLRCVSIRSHIISPRQVPSALRQIVTLVIIDLPHIPDDILHIATYIILLGAMDLDS